MNLRAVLKAYRESKKLTQWELAKQIGIKHLDLSRFESGKELSGRKMARIFYWLLISE